MPKAATSIVVDDAVSSESEVEENDVAVPEPVKRKVGGDVLTGTMIMVVVCMTVDTMNGGSRTPVHASV